MKEAQTWRKTLAPGIAQVLKRLHYPLDLMLLCVRRETAEHDKSCFPFVVKN